MLVSHFRKSSGPRALLCVGAQKCLIAAAGHSKDNVGKIIFRVVFMLHPATITRTPRCSGFSAHLAPTGG